MCEIRISVIDRSTFSRATRSFALIRAPTSRRSDALIEAPRFFIHHVFSSASRNGTLTMTMPAAAAVAKETGKSIEEFSRSPNDGKDSPVAKERDKQTAAFMVHGSKTIRITPGTCISSKSVRYTLQRKIADSKGGAVFEVVNERSETFAMKFEWKNPAVQDPKLGMEIAILRHLRQKSVSPHFIEYIDRCAKSSYYFMVTSLVGVNLEKLLLTQTANGNRFSVGTAVGVTLQVMDALREVHQLGYVHRDVRPHNLCIGVRPKAHVIYLINFGLAAIYIKNRKIRKPRNVVPMKGRLEYAPLTSHDHQEQSPKDDIEAAIYTMYALCDDLPWQGKTRPEEVRELKKKVRHDPDANSNFHKKLDAKSMSQIVKYLDELTYFDIVDYEFVKRLLNESAKVAQVAGVRGKFDWEEGARRSNSNDKSSSNDDEPPSSGLQVLSRRCFDH